MKIKINERKLNKIMKESYSSNNNLTRRRLSNLICGDIILMKDVHIINADHSYYYEKSRRSYVYLGNRKLLLYNENLELIINSDIDIADEITTHGNKTDIQDTNGNYTYNLQPDETFIYKGKDTGLNKTSVAKGTSYARFEQNNTKFFIPIGHTDNTDEIIDKLECYSNILLENINIENISDPSISIDQYYNDIYIECITEKGELWGSYADENVDIGFRYRYLDNLMMINDHDLNYLIVENFGERNAKPSGWICNLDENDLSVEFIECLLNNLNDIILYVDKIVLENIINL